MWTCWVPVAGSLVGGALCIKLPALFGLLQTGNGPARHAIGNSASFMGLAGGSEQSLPSGLTSHVFQLAQLQQAQAHQLRVQQLWLNKPSLPWSATLLPLFSHKSFNPANSAGVRRALPGPLMDPPGTIEMNAPYFGVSPLGLTPGADFWY